MGMEAKASKGILMTAIAGESGLGLESRGWLDRLLALEINLNAELIFYLGLVALTFALHYWDLGTRALHHDESLHATYSYYLYKGQGYKHDPLMHGPVLFHLTALMYMLFGATNATARFSAALAGTALVFTPYFLRRWIGRWGAIAASLLLLFSPSVLYYSRFIREDIFVALWSVGLFIGVWRYLQSRRSGWLYLVAASLALGFANKETTYMLAAIALVYADVLLAAELSGPLAQKILARRRSHPGLPPQGKGSPSPGSASLRRPLPEGEAYSIPRSSAHGELVEPWEEPEVGARFIAPRPGEGSQTAPSPPLRAAVFVVLIPIAWAAAILWYPVSHLRAGRGLGRLPASGDLLVILGTLTVPQLAALVQIPLKHFGYSLGQPAGVFFGMALSREQFVGGMTVLGLILATVLVGLGWDRRRWLISAAVFYGIYICLFTTFFTNLDGFGSGIWGSLDYWLLQQGVKRGDQPVFYYSMVLPVYEYLALAFALFGIIYQGARQGTRSLLLLGCAVALLPVVAVAYGINNVLAGVLAPIPIVLTVIAIHGNPLRQMLLVWFAGMFLGLSLAGEKMPWLTVHLAVPLTLLAGMGIHELLIGVFGEEPDELTPSPLPKREGEPSGRGEPSPSLSSGEAPTSPAGETPTTTLGVLTDSQATLGSRGPGRGQEEGSGGAVAGEKELTVQARLQILAGAALLGVAVVVPLAWGPGSDSLHVSLLALALAVIVVAWFYVGLRLSRPMQAALAGALVLGLLAPLSVRTALSLSFVHGDTPYEMLVYTQTSPDLPKIMSMIDKYAQQTGRGSDQPIVVDGNDAFTWPWAWYLRDYHNVSYPDLSTYVNGQDSGFRPPADAILLLNNADRSIVQQFPGQFGVGVPYHHRWWFPEDYRGTTVPSFAQSLLLGTTWTRWWGFIAAQHGIVMPDVPPSPGVHPIGTADATAYFPLDFNPSQGLLSSAAVTPAPKVQAGGVLTVGGPGSAAGAFVRPAAVAVDAQGNFYVADSLNNRIEKFDHNGEIVATSDGAGDQGALHEPWGVAVDVQGNVYVADTWNHRIVKLDPQLHFVSTWGYPVKASGPDSLLALYGPRAIAFDPAGNLLVTDTGDNRVIKYSPNGQPLGSFGSAGTGPGQFQEPVGIVAAPDGTIYVADTWNARIDAFDATMHYLRSLPVKGWESHSIENKPYLALLANGDLLFTQPDADHLIEMSPSGNIVRNVTNLGSGRTLGRPIGVAVDHSGQVYLSDGVSDQVTRLPLAALP